MSGRFPMGRDDACQIAYDRCASGPIERLKRATKRDLRALSREIARRKKRADGATD
jgi:hypothetical protein